VEHFTSRSLPPTFTNETFAVGDWVTKQLAHFLHGICPTMIHPTFGYMISYSWHYHRSTMNEAFAYTKGLKNWLAACRWIQEEPATVEDCTADEDRTCLKNGSALCQCPHEECEECIGRMPMKERRRTKNDINKEAPHETTWRPQRPHGALSNLQRRLWLHAKWLNQEERRTREAIQSLHKYTQMPWSTPRTNSAEGSSSLG